MAKGKGRAATGILCFILGFIFAIIAEVALIFGGVYWALHTDLDDLLSYLGVENTTTNDNGEEENVYINTETASTLSELISAIKDLYSLGTGALTIGDLDNLFPITGTTIQNLYSSVNESVGNDFDLNDIMDYDDLLATAIDDLSEFIADCIKDARIDLLMQAFGVDIEAEPLYMIVAYGSEAGTVTVSGTQYVLYYETYNYDETEDTYTRYLTVTNDAGKREKVEDTNTTITQSNSNLDYYSLIYSSSIDNRIYYYINGDTAYVVTRDNDDTDQDGNIYDATSTVYSLYSENSEYSNITGGYYYTDSGELVILNYRTVNDFMSGGLDSLFYDIYITELMETDSTDDSTKFIMELLDGVSLGALLNGDIEFSELLENIYVTDFLGDDETLLKLFDGYTLADLINGDVDFDELLSNLYIPDFVDVTISGDSTDNIMAYVAYSITDITDATDGTISYNGEDVTYTHTATLHLYEDDGYGGTTETTYTAYISTSTDNSTTTITGVYYSTDNGSTYTEYEGVCVSDISDQASRIMDVLTIADMMDVEADSAIMLYLGYGLSGLTDSGSDNGNYSVYTATYHTYATTDDGTDAAYSYDSKTVYVLVNDNDNTIYAVYATATDSSDLSTTTFSNAISSTSVNYISDRIDGLMDDLTIGDITGIGTGDDATNLEKKIGESKINNVSGVIENLTVVDAMGDVEYDSAIMAYLGYGISDITATDNSGNPYTYTVGSVSYNVYTATYHTYDSTNPSNDAAYEYNGETVYVLVNGTTNEIYAVYATLSGSFGSDASLSNEISSTPVSYISDRIDGLMNDLKIGEIADLDTSTTIMQKIADCTISEVSGVVNNLTVVDAMGSVDTSDENSAIMAYLAYGLSGLADSGNNVTIESTNYSIYTATYKSFNGDTYSTYDEQTVYVLVDSSNTIYAVYYQLASGSIDSNPTFSDDYEITSTLINNISDRMDGMMVDLTVGDLLGIDETETNTVLLAIKDSTLHSLSSDLESLTLQELYCNYIYVETGVTVATYKVVYKQTSSYIYYYKTSGSPDTYTQIQQDSSSTEFSSFVSSYSNSTGTIYYYNSTTGEYYEVIAFDADYLYFECIIDGSAYDFSYVTGISDGGSGYITGHLSAASDYSGYASSGASVSASSGADGMLYTYGLAQGMWKFLLYKDGVEVAYTVGDISGMTDNAASNIQSATLSDLKSAGIIDSSTDLTKIVYKAALETAGVTTSGYTFSGTSGSEYIVIGDLKLSDVVKVFVASASTSG